jgi:hypothetical protein
MEDAACTAVPVPDRAPPKCWRGRGMRAGNMGYSAEALAEQKRARELLAQSRELLRQLSAG